MDSGELDPQAPQKQKKYILFILFEAGAVLNGIQMTLEMLSFKICCFFLLSKKNQITSIVQ